MCQTLWGSVCIPSLHGHRALRTGTAYSRCLLAVPGDDADALVNLAPDTFRDAGGPGAGLRRLPRLLHLWRIWLPGHLLIVQNQPQITWAHFGKANARHT